MHTASDERLYEALRKAHTAGDTESAARLASYIKERKSQPRATQERSPSLDFSPIFPGMPKEAQRQIGLTGRAVAGGLAQAVQPFTEPVRYGLNKLLPGEPVGNLEQAADEALTKAGVPEPETDRERNVQGVGRFTSSIATGAGEAAVANKLAGVRPRIPSQKPPTTEELSDRASAAYKAADESGVVYKPESVQTLGKKIATAMKNEGIDPMLHKEATPALKRIMEAGENPLTIKELDTLRKIAKDVAGSNKKGERRLGKIMIGMIDDFVENARAGDVIAGSPKEAAKQVRKARELYTRKSKTESIEELFDKATTNASTYSASGFENALRTQFKQLARNPKRMRVFTPEEQAAIKLVARGGPMDNALRMLGKFAPRGIISGGLMPTALASTVGPEAAMLVTGAGEVGRRAATRGTMNNAADALEMMRRGGPDPAQAGPKAIPPWMIPAVIGADEGAY